MDDEKKYYPYWIVGKYEKQDYNNSGARYAESEISEKIIYLKYRYENFGY